MKKLPPALALLLASLCSLPVQATPGENTGQKQPAAESTETAGKQNRATQYLAYPLFGDLHVHTRLSFDAYSLGNRSNDYDQALSFARGGTLTISNGEDSSGNLLTTDVSLLAPLDFVAITDHADYLGEVEVCTDILGSGIDGDKNGTPLNPNDDTGYYATDCKTFKSESGTLTNVLALGTWGDELQKNPETDPNNVPTRNSSICGSNNSFCNADADTVWTHIQQKVNAYNDPGNFTTFIAYEWTAMPDNNMMHRNIIFRNTTVPALPVTYFEEQTPEGLWNRLAIDCTGTCEFLAIPHNPNLSNGEAFKSQPSSSSGLSQLEWANTRVQNEPLVEIVQTKGDSECNTGAGNTDEQCNFEKLEQRPVCDGTNSDECVPLCTEGVDTAASDCVWARDYVRNALEDGLKVEGDIGVNPFAMGFVGALDTHISAPGFTLEDNYHGHHAAADDESWERLDQNGTKPGVESFQPYNPGGLTAVWAAANTRDDIFDALKARTTYATSGKRITLAMFADPEFPNDFCQNLGTTVNLTDGFTLGVPMGQAVEIPFDTVPRIAVYAKQDVSAPSQTVDLDRIQIIKGWRAPDGTIHEKVYDICSDGSSPTNGVCADSVTSYDLSTCPLITSSGNDELCTVWSDPDYNNTASDPNNAVESVFYYVRVLEKPTCRWSQLQCNADFAALNCSIFSANGINPCDAATVEDSNNLTDTQKKGAACCCNANDKTVDYCRTQQQANPGITRSTFVNAGLDPCDTPAVSASALTQTEKDMAACFCTKSKKIIQERAWSSPIWMRIPVFRDSME